MRQLISCGGTSSAHETWNIIKKMTSSYPPLPICSDYFSSKVVTNDELVGMVEVCEMKFDQRKSRLLLQASNDDRISQTAATPANLKEKTRVN